MRKTRNILIVLCLFYLNTYSQEQVLHNDHTVFSVNKLKPHADFFAFETAPLAEKENLESSNRFLSLNGDWKFQWTKSPKNRLIKFYDIDYDDSNWQTIPVPSNWEVEKYGYPIYLDERYPFTTKWPNAPEDYNPVGTYRHAFQITNEWLQEDIILHFAGAKSAMYLYINGQYLGYSQGSKTPAEFNITKFIKEGENLIAVQMYRWSDASYLESQDMLRMSGIEREVFIYAKPKVAITDFLVIADLDSSYQNGLFSNSIEIVNTSSKKSSRTLKVQVLNNGTEVVGFEKLVKIKSNDTTIVNQKYIIKKCKAMVGRNTKLLHIKHSTT